MEHGWNTDYPENGENKKRKDWELLAAKKRRRRKKNGNSHGWNMDLRPSVHRKCEFLVE
jgi:hypothetical protein